MNRTNRCVAGLLGLWMLLSGCSRTQWPAVEPGTVIYRADAVLTMDASNSVAEAIAVRDGTVVAVGSLDSVRAVVGDAPQDERFWGKVITPGFVEPHLHPSLAGILLPMHFVTPHAWDLPGRSVPAVRGETTFRQRLAELAAQGPGPDGWIDVWGYHHLFHGDLSRAVLDAVSEQVPMAIWHRSFHEVFLNSEGLRRLELIETPASPGFEPDRGRLFENGLQLALARMAPRLFEPTRYVGALEQAKSIFHAGGITTIGDAAFGLVGIELELETLLASWGQPSTPFRTFLIPSGRSLAIDGDHQAARRLMDALPERNTERVQFLPRQVKLFADGAFYSQLMQLTEPGYTDGHHGEWLMTPDQLSAAARVYWDAGYQVHVHVNGDLGVDATLNVLSDLLDTAPMEDHRFTLHHYGDSRPDQAERLAELGGAVSANPYYLWALGDLYALHGLGEERAHHMVRSGSLTRAGVPLTFHSDFPMAPARPLLLAWTAAARLSAEGQRLGASERISTIEALRAITIEAARSLRLEEEIGSIEVGKRADFTVLEQDPTKVPVDELFSVGIWATVLGGEVLPLR